MSHKGDCREKTTFAICKILPQGLTRRRTILDTYQSISTWNKSNTVHKVTYHNAVRITFSGHILYSFTRKRKCRSQRRRGRQVAMGNGNVPMIWTSIPITRKIGVRSSGRIHRNAGRLVAVPAQEIMSQHFRVCECQCEFVRVSVCVHVCVCVFECIGGKTSGILHFVEYD